MIYLLIFLAGCAVSALVISAALALFWLAENPRVKVPWKTPGENL